MDLKIRKNDWKELVREYGSILGVCIGIFAIALLFLDTNDCISIIGDEFGYWTSAIFISGNSWKSLFATNSYYSWGYGILLAPLIILFHENTILMYKMAIVINALLVVVSFMHCLHCCKIILGKKKNDVTIIVISIAAVMYPSYLSFVNSAIVEILLLTLTWAVVSLAFDICIKKTKKLPKFLGMGLLSIYAFFVHQRCIGMIIATMIFGIIIFAVNIRKEKLLQYLISILLLVIIFLAGMLIKNTYTNWLYENVTNITTGLENDYSSVVGSLCRNFRLIPFIKYVFISSVGKCFYSIVGSFSILVFGMVQCIKNINLKKWDSACYFYIILLYLQGICISAIFMLDYNQRTDILLYGRYSEYTYSILIMLGLCHLLNPARSDFTIALWMDFLLGFIVYQFLPINSDNSVVPSSIFAFSRYIYECSNNREAVLLAIKITSIIVLFLEIVCLGKNNLHFRLMCCVLIIANVYTFHTNYKEYVAPWQIRCNEHQELAEFYLSLTDDEKLYALDADVYAKILQYALWNREIILVNSINDLIEGSYIITKYTKSNYEWVDNNYDCIYINNSLILWRYE